VKGRPVLGAIAGLFFGLFVFLDLVFFKVIGSDSILFVALPIAGLVLGIALGLWKPLGRAPSPPMAPAEPAPPV
jgi:hypothetical protein